MKKIIPFFIAAIVFVTNLSMAVPRKPTGGESTLINFNTPIRVLLARGKRNIEIKSLTGSLFYSTAESAQWKQMGPTASIKINPSGHGFTLNDQSISNSSLYLREQFALGSVRVNSSVYRGTVKLEWKPDGFWVINILPIDEYLSGIIGAEMSPSWELEALRAQVVAARTYALYMLRYPKNPYFDVESTIQDQVYSGTAVESPKIREAVLSTVGEYLAVRETPVKAFYHARCGGRTESAQAVWSAKGPRAKKTGVRCFYCQKNPQPWTANFKLKEFYKRLHLSDLADQIKKLRVAAMERSTSGRIASLKIGPIGKEKSFTADELRSLLGYTRLKSAYFNLFVEGNEVHFEGVGAGHGVGMCQWGARGMAQQGKSYREILAYYYPEASLSFKRGN